MDSKQAKDVLVGQLAERAAIDSVPLSDLEKRMLYFTEGPDAVEDPIQLNEEFGAQCETEAFEAKIWHLVKHARQRLKSQDPAKFAEWNKAVATLREGDHYILVMIGGVPWKSITRLAIRVLVPIATIWLVVRLISSRFGPLPHIPAFVFFALFIAIYVFGVYYSNQPNAMSRLGKAIVLYLIGKW